MDEREKAYDGYRKCGYSVKEAYALAYEKGGIKC
jgi:hypothetical protein